MIRKLKYQQIDFKKYSHCVETSAQRKYSASKDFLDITSGKNWELLVYDDYKAVMPVPFLQKFGLKFVANPKLCQQLGIFSESDLPDLNEKFLQYFRRKYRILYYAFNDANQFRSELETRKNFIIFPDDYEKVYQKYSPKRKRKIRQEEEIKLNSEIRKIEDEKTVNDFILENIKGAEKSTSDQLDFLKIFNEFHRKKMLDFTGYFYHNTLINLIAVYHDTETLALLGTFNNPEYVKISGASVLIDETLKESISRKAFDFEGGDIPNIEEFFRGFRPELKPYPYYGNSKRAIVKKILKLKF